MPTPEEAARIPPGQRLTKGWPILHAEGIPPFDPAAWRFRIAGAVNATAEWTWDEFRSLPSVTVTSDVHCVTGWSKLDNTWEGVPFHEVLDRAGPSATATHALIEAPSAYTANLPLDALADDDVLFAWAHDGAPLPPEHGGPLRLVVPKRYFWKSVKWAVGVRVLELDVRGYWEERGYHNEADPWAEQRYAWQEGR